MISNGAMKALPWGAALACYLLVFARGAKANGITPHSNSQPARLYVALLGTSP